MSSELACSKADPMSRPDMANTVPKQHVDMDVASDVRTLFINDSIANEGEVFCTNYVTTAKYTWWSFLPIFLYEQFSRYANMFFLFIAVIQQIPGVSPTGRWTTIIPLTIVLTATGIKEILEDMKRHRSDREVNDRLVRVLRQGTFQTIRWTEVQVGDIVRVVHDQYFPADLVLLSSSEPMGICYVETANLDGETNLKIKQAVGITEFVKTPGDARFLRGVVMCEKPNNRLYNFEGLITLHSEGEEKKMAIGPDQVLLRGAQLRNTPWVYGIAVFTGNDTKLMQNQTKAPLKRTQLERITNRQILILFFILLALSLLSAIGAVVWRGANKDTHWYLGYEGSSMDNFALVFLTFVILYNNLIPISLYITLEIVKYIQALVFINNDLDMYHEPSDTPAITRTSNLNEELGQVQYIFSDKTGTLTRNIMEMRKLSVGCVQYGATTGEPAPAGVSRKHCDEDGNLIGEGFHDPSLLDNLTTGHNTAAVIRQFLTLLAVCHTVIPEPSKTDPDEIFYQAQSPDEGALVGAVKQLGFSFNVRTPKSVIINVLGQDETYEVLAVLEFNSARKRMSVIVRTPSGSIMLLCKGADTVIYERLADDNPFAEGTLQDLEEFAVIGLRTLCLAVAELTEEQYQAWAAKYEQAQQSLTDRDGMIDACCEEIETGLFLLGATAIEDKLQDKVPETIANLLEAGIKVWMLTGDKQETAINIGYSCRLLTDDMNVMVCNEPDKESVAGWLSNTVEELRKVPDKESAGLALVIDGASLTHALSEELRGDLLEVSLVCKAVICCRVSPLQKAEVVNLVKNRCSAITLAIGDGANDVSMIQAAHVGIGISGQEGLQAARSADYAIAQFMFLQRLLLVHGNWSYRRCSKLVLYSFYKNIILYIVQIWFQFLNGFSGQTLFDNWMVALYNVMFTILPPLCLGVFDRHVKAETLMKIPQLYRSGINSEFFNTRVFWQWTLNSVYHSAVVFWICFAAYTMAAVLSNGQVVGQWVIGTTIYTAIFLTATLKICLIMDAWTKWTHVSVWGSILIYFLFLFVYCVIWPGMGYDIAQPVYMIELKMYGSAVFWFTILIAPLMANSRDYIWKAFHRFYNPEDYHIIQEMERLQKDPMLMKSAFSFKKVMRKIQGVTTYVSRGFAFSQEEKHGHAQAVPTVTRQQSQDGHVAATQTVGQAELIRQYDTREDKPDGI
ncbi:hypothetical protein SARC_03353 [Sphaeroforma arctica JP610]|uniref:Phospholipid-transporting ATPase n=1 Tax=Sphaeroforma arctica JP610 TaxID=667725 RepID=A0A0L0G5X1_9EUKA|nr:hypothetical protein SARC_03353 [Sphaeroforma arctica JP610]KNC84425.1 hypothetical protein SARC_03353 [Sphaeroforma arctica JP610]|eukprot:XP_014158327.1 hypothetical protein SARC_03353 [Sphaeroforma arctica JP610]